MKKVTLGFIVLFVLALFQPLTAQAAEGSMTTTVVKRTSCDQRNPVVAVKLPRFAKEVRFGVPDAEADHVLAKNVSVGTHRYALPRQNFGTTKQWVIVVRYADDSFARSGVLTFKRPARSACVVTQNVRITTYADNVNQVCPDGSQKLFILKTFVRKSSPGYFAGYGDGEIVLWSDRQLNTEGYPVPPKLRENDFFFYAPHRGAKVKKTGLENSVNLVLSSKNVEVRLGALASDCPEEFGS